MALWVEPERQRVDAQNTESNQRRIRGRTAAASRTACLPYALTVRCDFAVREEVYDDTALATPLRPSYRIRAEYYFASGRSCEGC